jgi:hypothetical protein
VPAIVFGALACAALLAFVVLLVLGMMRELAIARSETDALMRILLQDAQPSFLHAQLPAAIQQLLPPPNGHRHRVLLALSDGCGSCRAFLESLSQHDDGRLAAGLTCLLKVSTHRSPLVKLARRLTDGVVVDHKGELFKKLEVSSTPAMFVIDNTDGTVVGHKLGPDAMWVDEVLREGTYVTK